MSRRRIYLWLGLAVSSAAIALSLLDTPLWLRAPVGLPVVVLIPGFALLEVLDPKGRLGSMEHFALATGSSIAVTLVTGLLLSASPAGLRTITWNAGLGGLSIAMSLLALHKTREPHAARDHRLVLTPEWLSVLSETGTVFVLTTVLALALASVVATEMLGSEQAVEQGRASVLQLWAVPNEHSALGEIDVGIDNPTENPIECMLIVRQGQVVVQEQPLSLSSEDTLRLTVQPASNASIMFPVEIMLVDNADGRTLRRVAVWRSETPYWTNQAVGPEG